jgi:hypothetical protein
MDINANTNTITSTQFLTEVDLQLVRFGSEVMFLRQLMAAFEVERKEMQGNLDAAIAAKKAAEQYVSTLERQLECMIAGNANGNENEAENGSKTILQRASEKQIEPYDTERRRYGEVVGLRGEGA